MSQHVLLTEQYNGTAIVFRGDAWVNATQMAKPFNKQPTHFLRIEATRAFITALKSDMLKSISLESPVFEVVKGNHCDGRSQGTWMHPDLALEFARWLSPAFAIWTNRVIRRVLAGEPAAAHPVDLSGLVASIKEQTNVLRALHETTVGCADNLQLIRNETRLAADYLKAIAAKPAPVAVAAMPLAVTITTTAPRQKAGKYDGEILGLLPSSFQQFGDVAALRKAAAAQTGLGAVTVAAIFTRLTTEGFIQPMLNGGVRRSRSGDRVVEQYLAERPWEITRLIETGSITVDIRGGILTVR